ncbi:uncharacterized protein BX664DRAFT_317734 [Halteromyces radiatus]|uniref:uncharacterized protein n=1 Tax=Halteromyces radiatus TaxID=101107 RepID=UPI00221F8C7B|nr:uncharacterized protein BX664DRAFT_317734 [Halteromyces radiatus]KAI8079838.1 hypothetical protein BX664DRAFT_317734 [Halteromyces radiatus]
MSLIIMMKIICLLLSSMCLMVTAASDIELYYAGDQSPTTVSFDTCFPATKNGAQLDSVYVHPLSECALFDDDNCQVSESPLPTIIPGDIFGNYTFERFPAGSYNCYALLPLPV